MNGILIIDKPEGITSHDVVQAIRKKFRMSKVGHLGTLDPMATGVLPVSLGKATRLAQFLPSFPKEYEGQIRFGFATDTYDREGAATTETRPMDRNAEDIQQVMQEFTGFLQQIPPPYSAKKIGGVEAYKLARRNQTVDIPAVKIEVQQFDLLGFSSPIATFRVVCSAGTYVRSLVHDIGQRIGSGAHLTALRRTRSGEFSISQAVRLTAVAQENVVPMDSLLNSWPRIQVSESDENRVLHGNDIRSGEPGDEQFTRIFNKKGQFIAVAIVQSGWVRPRLVLTSTNSD